MHRPKNHSTYAGGDAVDRMEDNKNKFDKARRLLSRVMHRILKNTFQAWAAHARFERSAKELSAVVDPVADVLDKLPENRTPTDVQKLMPLVSKIDAYRQLHPPVRELLASYLQLAVLTERVELPRGPGDHTCLFSVVYGSVTAVTGDPADAALAAIRDFAITHLRDTAPPDPTSGSDTAPHTPHAGPSSSNFSYASSSSPTATTSAGGGSQPPRPHLSETPRCESTLSSATTATTTAATTTGYRASGGGADAASCVSASASFVTAATAVAAAAGASGGGAVAAEVSEQQLTSLGLYGAEGEGLQGAALERVRCGLWRTVVHIIHKLMRLQKAQALRELVALHAAALEDLAVAVGGKGAALAGSAKKAAAAAAAAAASGGGGGGAGGAAAASKLSASAAAGKGASSGGGDGCGGGVGAVVETPIPGVPEEAYLALLPALAALKTQVTAVETWQSFSGRELLCADEVGLAADVGGGGSGAGWAAGELPGRAIAAVTPRHRLVALVFVSREVYRRAMAMQSEISIRRAVDSCCRLPFLRHTPLKELYRLARHIHEAAFEPGEVILHQGRENGFLYFLIRGEVAVVLDLPHTSDPLALAGALVALGGSKPSPQQAQALAWHAAGGAPG
ncbi:hypothetical protein Agub_g7892, partial [Astrephomene gubernaculifera]